MTPVYLASNGARKGRLSRGGWAKTKVGRWRASPPGAPATQSQDDPTAVDMDLSEPSQAPAPTRRQTVVGPTTKPNRKPAHLWANVDQLSPCGTPPPAHHIAAPRPGCYCLGLGCAAARLRSAQSTQKAAAGQRE